MIITPSSGTMNSALLSLDPVIEVVLLRGGQNHYIVIVKYDVEYEDVALGFSLELEASLMEKVTTEWRDAKPKIDVQTQKII